MLHEIARAHQIELLANARRIDLNVQLAQVQKLERLQRSVRVVRARLGLQPLTAK